MNNAANECVSETLGDFVLVRLKGEVDLSWSQQVRRTILDALGASKRVGVELSQVSYIDSSGIAALVEGFQNARTKGSKFGLVASSSAVMSVLQLARLDKVFPLFASIEAARGVNAITRPLAGIGRATVDSVAGIGYAGMLLLESLYFAAVGWRIGQPLRIRSVFEQMRQIGVDALPIVTLLAMTIGIMLGIQFIAALSEFGAQSQVVVAVAKSVTREFGALITAILVAGRSGSALAARIGSMSVSQEVDALATMGIEPVRYLAAPALLSMLLMLPVLTVFADVVAIVGAALYSSPSLNVTPTAYLMQTLALLSPGDIWQGISKAFVFAILITLIGVSTGFSVTGGAEGVGRATTRSVVLSICYIIVADMIFSFFLNR